MESFRQRPIGRSSVRAGTAIVTLISGITLLFTLVIVPATHAQTFTVLHAFTGGNDGYQPYAGLTLDGEGNLYGTTTGMFPDQGTVFLLKHTSGNWILNTIDSLENFPRGRPVFGPGGSLYGTSAGGSGPPFCEFGCGSVYSLRPGCVTMSCSWRPTTLYGFTGGADGANPNYVDPVFDQAGNLYGTAGDGTDGEGVVFELTPSGGQWTESVIYNFTGGNDGGSPLSGLIFDSSGNLYGTTGSGGIYGQGTVFELSPSGSGWVASTLYSFQGGNDGKNPVGPLLFDRSGNLYGTTVSGGSGGGGTVFELSPSGGSWIFSLLYGLSGGPGGGPQGNLAMDAAGNLYGAAGSDGAFGFGSVFQLTPDNGNWGYTDLHNFRGYSGGVGITGGANPIGGVSLDANGNVYGTTAFGGVLSCGGGNGCGVVWKIAP